MKEERRRQKQIEANFEEEYYEGQGKDTAVCLERDYPCLEGLHSHTRTHTHTRLCSDCLMLMYCSTRVAL